MRRIAVTAATMALFAVPSLAQAQAPPLPPGEPPSVEPPAQAPAAPQETQAAPPEAPVGDEPPAEPALQAAGTVASIRLRGRKLVVKVNCTAGAPALLELVSIGRRRYSCHDTRTLRLRAPRAVVRRAQRQSGVQVRARISAPGFETTHRRVRLRSASVARASANRILCTWCAEHIFGGFGNQQTLEYWARTSGSWFKSGSWYLWWGDAQYYQNYAGGYVTTYRYWYYWNGSGWVNYHVANIGP